MLDEFVSAETIVTLAIGVVIGAVYLRYMWGALQRAVRTLDDADAGEDRFRFGLVGAVIAVIGSVVAVALYGVGPALLYAGPLLALASAVAVASCLRRETIDG